MATAVIIISFLIIVAYFTWELQKEPKETPTLEEWMETDDNDFPDFNNN